MKKTLPVYSTHPFQPLARIIQRVEAEFNKRKVPALRLKVPPFNFVMVRDPEIFRKVLIDPEMGPRKNTDDLWRFRWIMPTGGTVNPGTPDCMVRKRKVQRSMVEPALSYYADSLPAVFEKFIHKWNARTETFDIKEEAAQLAVQATFRMFFSKTIPDEEIESTSHKVEFLHCNIFNRMPAWLPTPNRQRFMKYGTEMRALFLQLLQERRASGDNTPDMIGFLQHLTNEDGTPYTDTEIVDEICSNYFGSTALVSSTAWMLYWLAAHPEYLQKAREEVISSGVTLENGKGLQNLPYCRMLAKEAMRLTPAFWSLAPRIVTQLEHPEYELPPGAKMLLSIHHVHRHPDLWEHPDRFYPEHFLPETEKQRHIYAYLPFGKGSRSCVGQHIALMYLQLFVAMLAIKSKIEHLPSHPRNPVSVMSFETQPNEVRVRFTPNAY